MTNFEVVFIDLDDTLIPSGHNYYIPQLDCARILVIEFGSLCPPPERLILDAEVIRKSNMVNMHTNGKTVFPQSWVSLYEKLCERYQRPVNGAIAGALTMAAKNFFKETYELYPGVTDSLRAIKQKKIIVTLGHPEIQDYKIKNTNVEAFVDGVEIVEEKNRTCYEGLVEKYNLSSPKKGLMIGNNIRLDIKPALDAGMYAWHVNHDPEAPPFVKGNPWFQELKSFNDAVELLKYDEKSLCNQLS